MTMTKLAKFNQMTKGTAEDYIPIAEAAMEHAVNLPERIIQHLDMLKGDRGGFAVDRYTPVSYTHLTLPTMELV